MGFVAYGVAFIEQNAMLVPSSTSPFSAPSSNSPLKMFTFTHKPTLSVPHAASSGL